MVLLTYFGSRSAPKFSVLAVSLRRWTFPSVTFLPTAPTVSLRFGGPKRNRGEIGAAPLVFPCMNDLVAVPVAAATVED